MRQSTLKPIRDLLCTGHDLIAALRSSPRIIRYEMFQCYHELKTHLEHVERAGGCWVDLQKQVALCEEQASTSSVPEHRVPPQLLQEVLLELNAVVAAAVALVTEHICTDADSRSTCEIFERAELMGGALQEYLTCAELDLPLRRATALGH